MSKIYTKEGWINWNWIMDDPASIIMGVGARGVGKSYGVFDWAIEHKEPFIYVSKV